jgi:hypothetical protein
VTKSSKFVSLCAVPASTILSVSNKTGMILQICVLMPEVLSMVR